MNINIYININIRKNLLFHFLIRYTTESNIDIMKLIVRISLCSGNKGSSVYNEGFV